MTTPLKLELKIIFDTNAIYTASKGHLLSYESSQLIKSTPGDHQLVISWYLPEIVVAERRYQIEQEASKLRSQVAQLEKVIRKKFEITEEQVIGHIAESISAQVEEHRLNVCHLDTSRVDWVDAILKATNRRPPFDEAPNSEKGFRDLVVLETVRQLIAASPTDARTCRVIFITGDGRLAEAAAAAVTNLANVELLGSIADVKGLINTLLSTLPESRVAELRQKAAVHFLDLESKSGLFYSLGVRSKVKEACGSELAALPAGASLRENDSKWLIVSGPSFLKKERERVWWTSRVKVRSRAYTRPQVWRSDSWKEDVLRVGTWNEGPQIGIVPAGEGVPRAQWEAPRFLPAGESVYSKLTGPRFLRDGEQVLDWSEINSSRFIASGDTFHEASVPSSVSGVPQFLPEPARLVATGVTAIDVIWSVSVDLVDNMTSPAVEAIQFAGTEWEMAE